MGMFSIGSRWCGLAAIGAIWRQIEQQLPTVVGTTVKLHELLKARRIACNLTLQEVADACGLTKGHVHKLENGVSASPSIQVCVRLSVVLGITVNQIAAAAMAHE